MLEHLQIEEAVLTAPDSGVVSLSRDWPRRSCPRLSLDGSENGFATLDPVPAVEFLRTSGYFMDDEGRLGFGLSESFVESIGSTRETLYLAGSFNGWPEAVGRPEWELKRLEIGGEVWRVCFCDPALLEGDEVRQFKFVSKDHRWLPVTPDALGSILDGTGNRNLRVNLHRSGHHRFAFRLRTPLDLSEHHEIHLHHEKGVHRHTLKPGAFFHHLRSDLPMGVSHERDSVGERTVFRLFAPRAKWVKIGLFEDFDAPEHIVWYPLEPLGDGAWETQFPGNLDGWFYWFRLDGPHNEYGHFDPERNILDPYARATVGREGPGIVLDLSRFGKSDPGFRTPQWQDLVVVEAHVRDLVAKAPILIGAEERCGYSGLSKWLDHPQCYLKRLGANAVELQPIQEFDTVNRDEYHWGYMPVGYFAPESSYAQDPLIGSQVAEFRDLVATFHRNGFSVLIDVVYNHVGEPNHLLFIDKLYYFELAPDASLMNWSGCGNDLRCSAAMTRRLITDSLRQFVQLYGVDGFRFDLAELIGRPVLEEIERSLKAVKPDVILIAEPWSFRGHIAGELRDTGYASWNDGFRNFLRDYLRGGGQAETAAYYLKGSPWHFAKWPAQTVNYVESHDDRTWIDLITENHDGNGTCPTLVDIQRTHLMVAFLMASLGIPMLHAGQDFLVSKQGEHNTYQNGAINALDFRRIFRFPGTHRYFSEWIRLRLSPLGRLIRLYSAPDDGYFSIHQAGQGSGLAMVYNADGSLGTQNLLFAINPEGVDVRIPLGFWGNRAWLQVADQERCRLDGIDIPFPLDEGVYLPPRGCGLWVLD
ncbi:MAG: glycoside hydrolase family 1 [Opitutaceae bacterium]